MDWNGHEIQPLYKLIVNEKVIATSIKFDRLSKNSILHLSSLFYSWSEWRLASQVYNVKVLKRTKECYIFSLPAIMDKCWRWCIEVNDQTIENTVRIIARGASDVGLGLVLFNSLGMLAGIARSSQTGTRCNHEQVLW